MSRFSDVNTFFALLNRSATVAKDTSQQIWTVIKPNQALSWQTLLFLSLFSWAMALLTSDSPLSLPPDPDADPLTRTSPAKYALFTMGWIFLTMSVGWLLSKSKYKMPFLEVELRPAAWVAAAITCAFAFRIWNGDTLPTALTGWFLLSAIYYIAPRVLDARTGWKMPEVGDRQKYLLVLLVSALLSCWTGFYSVAQDWLQDYPVLQAVPLESSTFVSQFGSPPEVLSIAKAVVAERLEPLTVPEIRRWLANPDARLRSLNEAFDMALQQAGVANVWAIAIVPGDFTDPATSFHLLLLADPPSDPTVVASSEIEGARSYALDVRCEATQANPQAQRVDALSWQTRQISSSRLSGAEFPTGDSVDEVPVDPDSRRPRRSLITCPNDTMRLRQYFS